MPVWLNIIQPMTSSLNACYYAIAVHQRTGTLQNQRGGGRNLASPKHKKLEDQGPMGWRHRQNLAQLRLQAGETKTKEARGPGAEGVEAPPGVGTVEATTR